MSAGTLCALSLVLVKIRHACAFARVRGHFGFAVELRIAQASFARIGDRRRGHSWTVGNGVPPIADVGTRTSRVGRSSRSDMLRSCGILSSFGDQPVYLDTKFCLDVLACLDGL